MRKNLPTLQSTYHCGCHLHPVLRHADVDAIPRDSAVTFCACPHDESVAAAQYLKDAGHEKVVVLDEGYIVRRLERGYPTTDSEMSSLVSFGF